MKKISILKVQETLFEKEIRLFTVADFERIFQISYENAKKNIIRYVNSGFFIKAKKGLYFIKSNPPCDFELANRLYQPSYISFDTALSYYGIIPETVYEITSVTSKNSRNFKVKDLRFSYKKIKRDCFGGYSPEKINNSVVLIAEPEKAFADYLYFIALGKRKLSYERIFLKKLNRVKLRQYIKRFQNKQILKITDEIFKKQPNSLIK